MHGNRVEWTSVHRCQTIIDVIACKSRPQRVHLWNFYYRRLAKKVKLKVKSIGDKGIKTEAWCGWNRRDPLGGEEEEEVFPSRQSLAVHICYRNVDDSRNESCRTLDKSVLLFLDCCFEWEDKSLWGKTSLATLHCRLIYFNSTSFLLA